MVGIRENPVLPFVSQRDRHVHVKRVSAGELPEIAECRPESSHPRSPQASPNQSKPRSNVVRRVLHDGKEPAAHVASRLRAKASSLARGWGLAAGALVQGIRRHMAGAGLVGRLQRSLHCPPVHGSPLLRLGS